MTDSKRETAIKALVAVLGTITGPDVDRGEVDDRRIPAGGRIVVPDGDPGEPEIYLSPPTYAYRHRVPVAVQVQDGDDAARIALVDGILQAIGAALDADPTLGGAVEDATAAAPDITDIDVDDGAAIREAVVDITLDYATDTPLG